MNPKRTVKKQRLMTSFRSISPGGAQFRAALSILFSALSISACTSEIFPGADVLPEYFSDEREPLTNFVDALEAEPTLSQVWCVPPGSILGQGSSESEEFELSGELFEAFNPHCLGTEAAGAVIESHGTAVVLDPTENGTHYFRIDILRLGAKENRQPPCGWFRYIVASICDIPLDEGWVARYRWDDSNDLKKLYE